MAKRNRISSKSPSSIGGGGGTPPPNGDANIKVGPSYGQSLGTDNSTFNLRAAINLTKVGIKGMFGLDSAIALKSVNLSGGVVLGGAIDLKSLNLLGNTSIQTALEVSVGVVGMQPLEDTYLQQGAGTTSNGGATVLLSTLADALGDNENISYIAWDLTNYIGATAFDGEIRMYGRTNGVVEENSNVEIYTNATKPFEEDTATWDSDEQPPGTLRQTVSVPWGMTFSIATLTLDGTTRANMIGNWVYARVLGGGLLGVSSIEVYSKEFATDSSRPKLDFSYKIT
jgi:hypothetical protein